MSTGAIPERKKISSLWYHCSEMVGMTMIETFKLDFITIPKFLFSLSPISDRVYKMLHDKDGWASLEEIQ